MGLIDKKIPLGIPIRYRPKTKEELIDTIVDLLKKGNAYELNCIDVSPITDMSGLFHDVNQQIEVKEIDISEWDVSRVKNMMGMFYGCESFNADLSEWKGKVSDCYKYRMFDGCDTLEKKNKIPDWYKP